MKVIEEEGAKVVILLPAGDEVRLEFALSLASLCNHMSADQGVAALGIAARRTSILPDSRNMLAAHVLEGDYTHALWIDSDMEFPSNSLARLLSHRVDMVGINASMRRPPFRTTAMVKPGVNLVTTPDSTGIEKVHRMGFGMVLTTSRLLRKLAKKRGPMFSLEWIGNKGIHRGEDYYFCERVRRAGFQMWVDQSLSREVGHVGTMSFYPRVPKEIEEDTP